LDNIRLCLLQSSIARGEAAVVRKAGTAVKKTRGGAPMAPSTRDQRLS